MGLRKRRENCCTHSSLDAGQFAQEMLQSLKESVDSPYRLIIDGDNRCLLSLKIVSVVPDFAHPWFLIISSDEEQNACFLGFDKLVVDEYEES